MKSEKPSIPTHQQFLEEEEKLQIEKRAKWDSEQKEKRKRRSNKRDLQQ